MISSIVKIKKNFKNQLSELNFFYLGIFLLPSAPSISSIVLFFTAISASFKNKNYFKDKYNFYFIVSGILIILSSIINTFLREEIYRDTYNFNLIWIGLSNWLPYFWVFWVFQKFNFNQNLRRKFCFVLIAGSIPIIITGFLQYFLEFHGPFALFNGLITWYSREIDPMDGMTGLFNNANYLGIWLNIVWPFVLALFIETKEKPKRRIVSIILLISIFICTLLTFSRNAWLGMLLGTVLTLGLKSLKWIIPFLVLIVIPILLGIGFIPDNNFINFGQRIVPEIILHQFNYQDLANINSFPRIQIWTSAINYIAQKPLIGWGAGSFPALFEINNNYIFFGHTHNLPLEISLSFGIPVAILIIFSIIFLIIKSRYKAFKINYKLRRISYDKAWWISTVLIFTSHMFDIQYFDIRIGLTFWILLGGLTNIIREE